jgi:magnesium chelatase family protein
LLATIRTAALRGLEPVPVTIEVSITNGLPAFHVVGLPDAAVRESRERVVSALRESGFQFPLRRITVNLAPAGVRKEGSAFDLPIALAVLAASGQVPGERARGWLVVGELALDGALRRVRGALAYAECAAELGAEALVAPLASAGEAALAEALPVWPASSLSEVVGWLRGAALPLPAVATPSSPPEVTDVAITLDDIAGQDRAKRALEAAAAGGHNAIFIGPPGAGKTLLARALPALLTPLAHDEARELTKIHSVAGLLPEGSGLVRARPFRAPHASITPAALLGGGAAPRPGEITLAHRGVLFLDELPEFRRDALEALRQPLESGVITIARAGGACRFPAAFQLIAACNGCPCGNLGHHRRACRCLPHVVERYRARLSGPLLDRVDLQLEVAPVRARDLARHGRGRALALEHEAARARVAGARAAQEARAAANPGIARTNARLTPDDLERVASLGDAGRRRLLDAIGMLGLSARGYHRVWRLARTLADLDGVDALGDLHVHEALTFRMMEGPLKEPATASARNQPLLQ